MSSGPLGVTFKTSYCAALSHRAHRDRKAHCYDNQVVYYFVDPPDETASLKPQQGFLTGRPSTHAYQLPAVMKATQRYHV